MIKVEIPYSDSSLMLECMDENTQIAKMFRRRHTAVLPVYCKNWPASMLPEVCIYTENTAAAPTTK